MYVYVYISELQAMYNFKLTALCIRKTNITMSSVLQDYIVNNNCKTSMDIVSYTSKFQCFFLSRKLPAFTIRALLNNCSNILTIPCCELTTTTRDLDKQNSPNSH